MAAGGTMGVVNIAEAWPVVSRPFTVHDLDRMPDDGRRYELVDGVLFVGPAPANPHQLVVSELLFVLRQVCPRGLRALIGPGVAMSSSTELIPDLVVIPFEQLRGAKLTEPPLLTVEVRSPSTALVDLNMKKAVYERFGVECYWIVVPDVDKPQLIVFELRDGRYEQVAHVTGDEPFAAIRPFPVEVIPSMLVAGLMPD
jgi:Uma2 family endonuclease